VQEATGTLVVMTLLQAVVVTQFLPKTDEQDFPVSGRPAFSYSDVRKGTRKQSKPSAYWTVCAISLAIAKGRGI